MSELVYAFSPLIPAGTPKTAPVTFNLPLGPSIVNRVELDIPSGPNGLMGFFLGSSGGQIIPTNAGAFIIANDDHLGWDLDGLITSGAWTLTGYNLGTYDHTVYVRFLVSLTDQRAPAAPVVPLETAVIEAPVADQAAIPETVISPDDAAILAGLQ